MGRSEMAAPGERGSPLALLGHSSVGFCTEVNCLKCFESRSDLGA